MAKGGAMLCFVTFDPWSDGGGSARPVVSSRCSHQSDAAGGTGGHGQGWGRGHQQCTVASKLDQERRVSDADSDGSQPMAGGLRGRECSWVGSGGGGASAPTASGGISQIPALMFDCHTHISNTRSAGRSDNNTVSAVMMSPGAERLLTTLVPPTLLL